MRLRVSPDSAVPIYEQILSQVVFAVAAGDLPAGEAVPSVRELSQQLIVNANTVARAYQELERLGVVEARRGVGMFVTDGGPKVCRERRKVLVMDPYQMNPYSRTNEYWISIERVIGAVLLGIVTHDANLLIIHPRHLHRQGIP